MKLLSIIKEVSIKKKILSIVIVVLLICAVTVGVLVINNPFNKFKRMVNNEEGQAVELYEIKLKGNTEKEGKVKLFLMEELENAQNDLNDEKISYDEIKDKLKIIKQIKLEEINLDDEIVKIDNLNSSKEAFKKANDYIDSKNYNDAVIELSKVVENDKNYSKAKELFGQYSKEYKDNLNTQVEAYVKSNNFTKALEILESGKKAFGEEDSFIKEKVQYVEKQESVQSAISIVKGILNGSLGSNGYEITYYKAIDKILVTAYDKTFIADKIDKNKAEMKTGQFKLDWDKYVNNYVTLCNTQKDFFNNFVVGGNIKVAVEVADYYNKKELILIEDGKITYDRLK